MTSRHSAEHSFTDSVVHLGHYNVNGNCSEAGWLNESSCLAPALGVIKFIVVNDAVVLLKSDLDVQQTHLYIAFMTRGQGNAATLADVFVIILCHCK